MGACISSPDEDAERDRTLHREAEKLLKEVCSQTFIHLSVAVIGARCFISLTPLFQAKTRMASQVKVKFSLSLQGLTISLNVLPGLTPRIRRLGKVNGPQSA